MSEQLLMSALGWVLPVVLYFMTSSFRTIEVSRRFELRARYLLFVESKAITSGAQLQFEN